MPDAATRERWRARARAGCFVALAAFIVGAPVYRQLLGGKNRHLRAWVMFSGIGLGAVEARFSIRRPDGTLEPIDRFAARGQKAPDDPRRRRIKGARETWNEARRICRASSGSPDVRVEARRATRDGWVVDFDGTTNLCTEPAPGEGASSGNVGSVAE
jgi:hypothetical protein